MNPEEENITLESESICQEAHRIQCGSRQQDYGSPQRNFEDIARVWNAYMCSNGRNYPALTDVDVANMMIMMKICRNVHKPKRDNWVDIAGYAQCGAKCENL